jgi:hypothetical protein
LGDKNGSKVSKERGRVPPDHTMSLSTETMEMPIETEVVFNGPEVQMDSLEGRAMMNAINSVAKKRGNTVWMMMQSGTQQRRGQILNKLGWKMTLGGGRASFSTSENGEPFAEVTRLIYTKAGNKPREGWGVRMEQSVFEALSETEMKEMNRLIDEDLTKAFGV